MKDVPVHFLCSHRIENENAPSLNLKYLLFVNFGVDNVKHDFEIGIFLMSLADELNLEIAKKQWKARRD